MLALGNKKVFRLHRTHSVSYARTRRPSALRRTGIFALAILTGVSFMLSSRVDAAIAFRAASTANNAGGATSLSIAMPTGVVAGDVMVAIISVRGGTNTAITPPSGWSLINYDDSTTVIKSATYYKVASAGETGPYSWGWAASLKASGVISAYSGVDNTNPIMTNTSQGFAASAIMTAPFVTTTVDNSWIIAAYTTANGTTVSAGSGMTLRGQDASTGNPASSNTTSGLQDISQVSAGISGDKTMTAGIDAVNIGHTIALSPAPTFEQSGYRWYANTDSAAKQSSTFAQAWGLSINHEFADASTYDGSGNLYVAGSSISSGLTSGDFDQTLTKYNSSGVEQWVKTWGGDGDDEALGVATDASGNIYVSGYTSSTGLTSGSYDQTLIKYNSSGVEQWSKTWGGDGDDRAKAITIDGSGNIYVVGHTTSTGLTAGGHDQTLVKYNSSGVKQWSKTWGGDGTDEALGVATDTSGNIYVVGYTASTGLTAGGNDQTLIKYNSSGIEQWSKTWGGDGDDRAKAVVLDGSGNIYVVGYTTSTGLTAGSWDQTLVKYNSSGVEQWSKTWGGAGVDVANAIALDNSDNIYLVGYTTNSGASVTDQDQTLVKYNSSGVEQWSKTWGGAMDSSGIVTDTAFAVTLNSFGNIYVAGYVTSSGLTVGSFDQTLLKFDSTGSIANCPSCVDRAMTEVDRTMTEVDRTVTEVDRTTSEVDHAMTEVDRTGVAVITDNIGMDVGAPLGGVAQNTATTAPAAGTIFRLRTQVHVADNRALAGSASFKLQYATMSGACDTSFSGETYADVTTSSAIAYANNTLARDGQLLLPNANDPTHSGHTTVFQEYNETNNTAIVNNIAMGQDGMWDFALKDNTASPNTSYCFRIVKSDNSLLNTYSYVPQITTRTSIDQQMRGGQSVIEGVKQPIVW